MELSLFFPAFNEEANIKNSVRRALAVLPGVASQFEVIVVDDGSSDSTLKVSRQLVRKHYRDVRVVSQEHKGYGAALKLGFAMAKYNWVFFTDADLQFDLREIKRLIRLSGSNDLIIGFRKNRAEGWRRHIFAVALRFWNWLFLSFPWEIRDTDCAFKLIKRQVVERISPLECEGAMISTELIFKAYRAGFRIAQVPVSHYPRQFGQPTGNSLKVILQAIKETVFLQKLLLFGRQQNAYEIPWR